MREIALLIEKYGLYDFFLEKKIKTLILDHMNWKYIGSLIRLTQIKEWICIFGFYIILIVIETFKNYLSFSKNSLPFYDLCDITCMYKRGGAFDAMLHSSLYESTASNKYLPAYPFHWKKPTANHHWLLSWLLLFVFVTDI